MTRAEEWHHGYILHTRPFRETSVIAETFTEAYGRVSMVFRGVKSATSKNNKARQLQPFQPLTFLWQGQRELKTGKKFEPNGAGYFFTGKILYSALYINELMLRLLQTEDPHPYLYQRYQETLSRLQQTDASVTADIEILLRRFEWCLLTELGYQLTLDKDAEYADINPSSYYRYDPELGFVETSRKLDPGMQQQNFSGAQLLAISQEQWQDQSVLQAAKRLMRQALAPHLGGKPLESRQLFRQS